MPPTELVGNNLCLDFVNTVNARPQHSRDSLSTPEGAQAWCAAVGHRVPMSELDEDVLASARDLRELVHRVMEPLTRDASPSDKDVLSLTDLYARSRTVPTLTQDIRGFELHWPPDGTLSPVLDAVTQAAVDLLRFGPLDRLGACGTCGWLFLDTSRNGRRRWCSMTTCGARDKARRHYWAQKQ